MKPLQKIGAAAMAGALALVLGACGAQPASAPEAEANSGSYKIGVIQLTEHPALDAANEGFIAALDDSGIDYTVDQQNAQGDQSACQTIASKLVNDDDDLILAIATPAAQAVAGSTTEIPIVGTAVTDFAEAGLVESNDAPGGNVTGTSDLNPVSDQIALLQRLVPQAKTVGILYCSAEDNSGIQAELAEEACKNAGLATQRFTVSSSNELQQVVESMAGKVDAVYAPTDNVIAAGIATVSMVANENGLPVICGEENMVNGGGLATYSLNSRDLGYRAGEMAVKILKGEAKPADMPIEYLSGDDLKLVVNEDTAKTLGIDVSGLQG